MKLQYVLGNARLAYEAWALERCTQLSPRRTDGSRSGRQRSRFFRCHRRVEKRLLDCHNATHVLKGRGELPPLDGNRGAGCFSQVLTGLALEDGTPVKARYCNVCELWYNSAKKAPWDLGKHASKRSSRNLEVE